MNRIIELECLLRYTDELKKDVDSCLFEANYFYESYENYIDTICVYGISLGAVDIPYFKEIRKNLPNSHWQFSFYSDTDLLRIKEVAKKDLKINKNKYSTFKLFNRTSGFTRDEIIKIQGIQLIN